MSTAPNALATMSQKVSLSAQFADKYGVDQNKVYQLLKDTALKSKEAVSDAEVAAFMTVCNRHDLDPFLKEIHGFMSKGKMQYVVGVDGWATLLNRQPNLNGIEFEEHFKGDSIYATTCKIHRKDRALPTVITEYFSECRRDTDPWKQSPIRMLRHKALIQCARIAFGLAGVIDEDEAERMPGFIAGPVVEGERDNVVTVDIEAVEIMNRLGWPAARKNNTIRSYDGRPDALLAYLRETEGKSAPKVKRGAGKTVEAQVDKHPEPAEESQEADVQEQEEANETVDYDKF